MSEKSPAVSLVMATLGRTEPIRAFVDSVCGQPADGVELIIVDQNQDDRVERVLAQVDPGHLSIRHIRAARGLSHARNVGASAARGEILGFPDDDCWYPPQLLPRVLEWFAQHPGAGGLSCLVLDKRGRFSAGGYMARRAGWVTRANVWRTVTSNGLFVRGRVHAWLGGFDERIGLNAPTPWGSAEESDYALRAIRSGHSVFFDPAFVVLHPRKVESLRGEFMARAWRYGQGHGYVLQKNGFGVAKALYHSTLPLLSSIRAALAGEPGRACARVCMGAGRMVGWSRAHRWVEPKPAAGRSWPSPVTSGAPAEVRAND